MKISNSENQQRELCRKYGVSFEPLDFNLKLGVADNFFPDLLPLNGLRHPPENGTCGWFLWAGEEWSEADDYFNPLHIYHLIDKKPEIIKYLALPEGWRFLATNVYEDVWFDENLLNI